MQKLSFTLIFAIFIAGCGKGKGSAAGALVVPALPADYTALDLTQTGLKATVKAPAGATAEKSTLDDNEGKRPYYIVRAFSIPSDAANPDRTAQAKFDIYSTKRPFGQHREEVKFRPTIGWKSWLKDEGELIVFAARPGNSIGQPIREKDSEVYHFMLLRQGADGQHYIVASSSSMDYTKDEMLRLLAIAQSLKI